MSVSYLHDMYIILIAIKSGLCLNARQSCQTGCPIEYRSTLWNMALGIDCSLPQVNIQVCLCAFILWLVFYNVT